MRYTNAERRTQAITAAHKGNLEPLCALVERLRQVGMPGVPRFDYNDMVAFFTRTGECDAGELDEWFYEMDGEESLL